MIDYRNHFIFSNDIAMFDIWVYTQEHPSGYGNGTLLCFDVLSEPREYSYNHVYDVRYEHIRNEDDMHKLVLKLIYENYGVEF